MPDYTPDTQNRVVMFICLIIAVAATLSHLHDAMEEARQYREENVVLKQKLDACERKSLE